jgi:uncharacterized protein YggE
MKASWILFTASCLTAASIFAQAKLEGTPSELSGLLTNIPRTAAITGEAEVRVQADRAVITVKVSTTAKELGQALRANQQARSKLGDRLTGQGIPADQVRASKFSSTEKYSLFSEKVKSHRVDNLLKVAVRSEQEFQIVADAVDATPEAQYLGIEFERSDKAEVKARAIGEACDNANEHRKMFEQKLGLKLTPKRFAEPGAPSFDPNLTAGLLSPAGAAQNRALGFSPETSSYVTLHALQQRPDDTAGFGELTFKAQVTVEYLVESR